MQCREFEDRLNDLLDQRLAPERDVLLMRHAGECLDCRQLLNGQVTLFAGLKMLDKPVPSRQFAAVVLEKSGVSSASALHQQPRPKSRWVAIAAGVASLAAIVLVGVLIDMMSHQPQSPPVARQPAPPGASLAVANSATPPASVPPLAKAVTPPRVMPPVPVRPEYQEYRDAINSLAAQIPTAVETIDEVQQSSPAIRPLRASFSMAIGTLQRTIPSRNKRETRPLKPDSGFFGSWRNTVV